MSNLQDLFSSYETSCEEHGRTHFADVDDEYATTNIEYKMDEMDRLDFDTLTNTLCDRDLPPHTCEELCEKYNREDQLTLLECINNVFSLYTENQLYHLQDVIEHISRMPFLPFPIRVKAAQTLIQERDEEVSAVFAKTNLKLQRQGLLDVCTDVIQRPKEPEFNHTLLFELLVDLAPEFPETTSLMSRVLTSEYLEEEYRFTLFQYLRSKTTDGKIIIDVLQQVASDMIEHVYQCTHAVLLAQIIPIEKLRVQRLKDLIVTDRDAAEICDFLLEAKVSEDDKAFAKERLGQIKGVSRNVFESTQNLHEVSVDIESFVEKMMEFDVTPYAHLIKRFPQHEAVIQRIAIDSNLYSSKALSIVTLMGKCWTCIQVHESRQELEKRFSQELEDMRDTCTSGHLVRLMNVFSGWMEGVKLDVKIEIQSVVFYRLRKMIDALSEEDKATIIDELGSIEVSEEGVAQMAIQHHLFKPIAELHDEMWNDYDGLVDAQKFAEYFRNALIDFTIEKTN